MIKDLKTTIYKYKTFIAVSTVIIVLLSVSVIPRSLYTPQTTAASSFGASHSDPNSLNSVIGKFGSSSSQSGFGSNTLNGQPSSSDTINQFTGLSKASGPNNAANPNTGNANGGSANGGSANGGDAHGNNGNAHSTGSGSATGGSGNGNSANGGTGGAGGTGGNGGNKYSNTGSFSGGFN